jgi:hypothetical protein
MPRLGRSWGGRPSACGRCVSASAARRELSCE